MRRKIKHPEFKAPDEAKNVLAMYICSLYCDDKITYGRHIYRGQISNPLPKVIRPSTRSLPL